MPSKEAIIETLDAHRDLLKARFGVVRIGLFGSHAKDAATASSDVDILVALEDPTFDRYMDLKFFLEDAFQKPVDLVMEETVKPALQSRIRLETIYV